MTIIVIVENEPVFALLAQRKIRSRGAILHIMTRGELLQSLPLIRPDIILLDRALGSTTVTSSDEIHDYNDGLKLIATIKKLYPDVRVIVWSGRDNKHSIREAQEAGADGFVSKQRIELLNHDMDIIISSTSWFELIPSGDI